MDRSTLVVFSLALLALGQGCATSAYRMEAPSSHSVAALGKTPLQDALDESKREGFGLDKQVDDREGKPVTDEEVAKLLDWRVALPERPRVAVLEARAYREFYESVCLGEPRRTVEGAEWTARPAPPEDVAAIRDEVVAAAGAEGVSTVPSLFLPARADLGRCRYAAARTNADLVLLYARATRVVRYHNKLANLYPLIVGLFLPGEETVVVTRVEGALLDVRTGRVFAVAQGAGRGSDSSSPFSASDEGRRTLMDSTERAAVLEMAKGLAREMVDVSSRREVPKKRRPVEREE